MKNEYTKEILAIILIVVSSLSLFNFFIYFNNEISNSGFNSLIFTLLLILITCLIIYSLID